MNVVGMISVGVHRDEGGLYGDRGGSTHKQGKWAMFLSKTEPRGLIKLGYKW